MTTKTEYDAGTLAAIKLINAEINADIQAEVPMMFRNDITPDAVRSHAEAVARAVIDAAEAVRAKARQQT